MDWREKSGLTWPPGQWTRQVRKKRGRALRPLRIPWRSVGPFELSLHTRRKRDIKSTMGVHSGDGTTSLLRWEPDSGGGCLLLLCPFPRPLTVCTHPNPEYKMGC